MSIMASRNGQYRQRFLRWLVYAIGLRTTRDVEGKFIRCLVGTDHYNPPLIVMDPIVARAFVDLGFNKQTL